MRSLESPYENLCADLLSGKIDFIVGALRRCPRKDWRPSSNSATTSRSSPEPAHTLAARRSIGLRELDEFPWVLSRAGTPLRRSFEAFFARHGRPAPQPTIETGDLDLLRGLLLQGGMLTALSAHQLRYEIENGSLIVLPLAMTGMRREISITTRAGAHLWSGANALLDEIRRVGSEVAAAERAAPATRKP